MNVSKALPQEFREFFEYQVGQPGEITLGELGLTGGITPRQF